ncbi:MAG: ATP-binding cassette domain-containing protein, partial [Paracoccaceae bacterium]
MSDLLTIKNLNIRFRQDGAQVHAVRGIGFTVKAGEVVALVGESGSGKSVTALSTVALLGASAEISGSITYQGRQMVGVPEAELQQVRGNDISFIFQEPMMALNPCHRIGKQISESLILHRGMDKREALRESVSLLEKVGIPAPERRIMEYPHQLSG